MTCWPFDADSTCATNTVPAVPVKNLMQQRLRQMRKRLAAVATATRRLHPNKATAVVVRPNQSKPACVGAGAKKKSYEMKGRRAQRVVVVAARDFLTKKCTKLPNAPASRGTLEKTIGRPSTSILAWNRDTPTDARSAQPACRCCRLKLLLHPLRQLHHLDDVVSDNAPTRRRKIGVVDVGLLLLPLPAALPENCFRSRTARHDASFCCCGWWCFCSTT